MGKKDKKDPVSLEDLKIDLVRIKIRIDVLYILFGITWGIIFFILSKM